MTKSCEGSCLLYLLVIQNFGHRTELDSYRFVCALSYSINPFHNDLNEQPQRLIIQEIDGCPGKDSYRHRRDSDRKRESQSVPRKKEKEKYINI